MSKIAEDWAKMVIKIRNDLTPTEALCLLALAWHHHPRTGQCFPSHQTIADTLGRGRTAIVRAILGLEDKGVIRTERTSTRGGRTSNRYTLLSHKMKLSGRNKTFTQRKVSFCDTIKDSNPEGGLLDDSRRDIPLEDDAYVGDVPHNVIPLGKAAGGGDV